MISHHHFVIVREVHFEADVLLIMQYKIVKRMVAHAKMCRCAAHHAVASSTNGKELERNCVQVRTGN